MAEEKKTTRRTRRTKSPVSKTPIVDEEVLTPQGAPTVDEKESDEAYGIKVAPPSMNFGVYIFDSKEPEVTFQFLNKSHRVPSKIEPPDIIKLTHEGGNNSKLELYYKDPGRIPSLDLYDQTLLNIKLGTNPKTGNAIGYQFRDLFANLRIKSKINRMDTEYYDKVVLFTYTEHKPDFTPINLSKVGFLPEKEVNSFYSTPHS